MDIKLNYITLPEHSVNYDQMGKAPVAEVKEMPLTIIISIIKMVSITIIIIIIIIIIIMIINMSIMFSIISIRAMFVYQ